MTVTKDTPIEPNVLYTIEQVATIYNRSVKWVKRTLIYSEACKFQKAGGGVYSFKGAWLIAWAEKTATRPKDDPSKGS